MAMQPPIHPGKTSNRQHDRKYQHNQAAPSETTQTFLGGGASTHVFIKRFVTSLQRYSGLRSTIQSLACRSHVLLRFHSLSYKARKPSERHARAADDRHEIRVTGPGGTTWMCK